MKFLRRISLVSLLIALALIAAGCASAQSETETVVFNQEQITPTRLEIQPGTTVIWMNDDTVPHTVTAGARQEPSGLFDFELVPGGEFEFTFDEQGVYEYYCRYHPETAEIIVTE